MDNYQPIKSRRRHLVAQQPTVKLQAATAPWPQPAEADHRTAQSDGPCPEMLLTSSERHVTMCVDLARTGAGGSGKGGLRRLSLYRLDTEPVLGNLLYCFLLQKMLLSNDLF